MRHNLFKTQASVGHASCAVLAHAYPMTTSSARKYISTRRFRFLLPFYYNHGAGQTTKCLANRQLSFQDDFSRTAFNCNGFQPSTYTPRTLDNALNCTHPVFLIDQFRKFLYRVAPFPAISFGI